jgi:hypothetical protein
MPWGSDSSTKLFEQREYFMKRDLLLGTLLLAVLVAGCAPSPTLNTSNSSSAIRTAEAAGANSTPLAALHLKLAREAIADAEGLASKGKLDRAESMLLRAEADAELAILLSREQSEKSEAAAAMERVRRLQGENR